MDSLGRDGAEGGVEMGGILQLIRDAGGGRAGNQGASVGQGTKVHRNGARDFCKLRTSRQD